MLGQVVYHGRSQVSSGTTRQPTIASIPFLEKLMMFRLWVCGQPEWRSPQTHRRHGRNQRLVTRSYPTTGCFADKLG